MAGVLGSLRRKVAAALGDPEARRAEDAVRKLKELQSWHEMAWYGSGALRSDVERLAELTDELRADELRNWLLRLAAANRAIQSALEGADQARRSEQWSALEMELTRVEAERGTLEAERDKLHEAVAEHLARQRAAWAEIEDCGACLRASVLADELVASPDLAGLAKPEVSEFLVAYAAALDAVPSEYRDDGLEQVCFDPERIRELAQTAARLAPEAERRLTDYFYQAARGYEAALGPERTRQVRDLLRDPATVARMRQQRPELFTRREALAGSGFSMFNPFTLMMLFWLMQDMSPDWTMPASLEGGVSPVDQPDIAGWIGSTEPLLSPDADLSDVESLDTDGGGDRGDFDGGGDFGGDFGD